MRETIRHLGNLVGLTLVCMLSFVLGGLIYSICFHSLHERYWWAFWVWEVFVMTVTLVVFWRLFKRWDEHP